MAKKRKQSKSKVSSAPQAKPVNKNTIIAIIASAIIVIAVIAIVFISTRKDNSGGISLTPSTATNVTQEMIDEMQAEQSEE